MAGGTTNRSGHPALTRPTLGADQHPLLQARSAASTVHLFVFLASDFELSVNTQAWKCAIDQGGDFANCDNAHQQ
jgi:hypothetical protein